MREKIIDIYKVKSWPSDLLLHFNNIESILNNHRRVSSNYAEQIIAANEYDKAIEGLKPVLSKFCLRGYHCTRLTDKEASSIVANGMKLQDGNTLRNRINSLVAQGTLEEEVANQLLRSNQANDKSRKHMLWFCFFHPHIAGQSGIQRLFNTWGGEALYNSHEDNPVTGGTLRKIGSPYVVEALVPLSSLKGYNFEINFADRYLCYKTGCRPRASYYEGYSTVNLPAEAILNVIQYPSAKFIKLTRCNTWDQPLT